MKGAKENHMMTHTGGYIMKYDYLSALENYLKQKKLYENQSNEYFERRNAGHVFSEEEHVKALIYALLSSNRQWKGIEKNKGKIDKIFFNYDIPRIKQTEPQYFIDEIKKIQCGNRRITYQMKGLCKNLDVFDKIIKERGSLDKFVSKVPVSEVCQMISKAREQYKLLEVGKALACEYLKNVGIDAAKPDTHLMWFFGNNCVGISSKERATEKETLDAVERLHEQTGRSRTEIDYLIWKSMEEGKLHTDPEGKKIIQRIRDERP